MTDKQIIIDGIDVSRCRYYDDRYGYCDACRDDIDGASFTKCLYEDNCYYKQLKAKEQECEELKDLANHNGRVCNERLDKIDELEHNINELNEQLNAYKMEADEGKEINAELKAENEELTTINARLLGRLEVDETDTSLVFNLDKELRQKEKEFYTAIQKVVKLKQTLTEIKEIIQNQGHIDILAKQILQKISECEGE